MEISRKNSLKILLIFEVIVVLTIVFFIVKKRYNAVKYPIKKVAIVSIKCLPDTKAESYITVLYENKDYKIPISKIDLCNKLVVNDSIKVIYSTDLDKFILK